MQRKQIRIKQQKNKVEFRKMNFTQHYVSLQKLLLSSKKSSSSESSYVSSSKSMSEIQIKCIDFCSREEIDN